MIKFCEHKCSNHNEFETISNREPLELLSLGLNIITRLVSMQSHLFVLDITNPEIKTLSDIVVTTLIIPENKFNINTTAYFLTTTTAKTIYY